MSRSLKAHLATAVALLPIWGCGATPRAPDLVVQDSAGIRVLIHRGAAPSTVEVTGTPESVFADKDDGSFTLYRVVGAVLTSDGGLVIGNGGNHEIVRFSRAGDLVWRVGGEGDGPEEFRSMTWLQGAGGDTVTVWDGRGRRASALDADGRFAWVRSFTDALAVEGLPPEAVYTPSPMVLAAHGDGTLVGYAGAIALPRGRRGPLPLEAEFRVYPSARGASPTTLGPRTVVSWYEDPSREGMPIANALGSARMWWGAHSGRMAFTSSIRPEIEVVDGDQPTMLIREDRRRMAFSPDSIPAGYDLAVDSLPAYEDLAVDGLHRIWARTDRDRDPATWRLWDASGLWLADVLLPADARVMDAAPGRLVLRRTNALDVERVEVHGFDSP